MKRETRAVLTALLLAVFIPSAVMSIKKQAEDIAGEKAARLAVSMASETPVPSPDAAPPAAEESPAPTPEEIFPTPAAAPLPEAPAKPPAAPLPEAPTKPPAASPTASPAEPAVPPAAETEKPVTAADKAEKTVIISCEEARPSWKPMPVPEDDGQLAALEALDLAALQRENEDVVGWILIPESPVNYPLLQAEDNSYYLGNTWQREANHAGSIFLECKNSPDFTDFNTIIYGHNMNNGSMFASLRSYQYNRFYAEHPYVYLVSQSGIFRCEVFSAYAAKLDSPAYSLGITREDSRRSFIDHALEQSLIHTPVTPAVTDRIITLSTCTSHGNDYRWVVHARLEMVPGDK